MRESAHFDCPPRRRAATRTRRAVVCLWLAVPAGYSRPASFDRSFNSAVAAMREQGVAITQEDRGAGIVRGIRGGIQVTAIVRQQADGSVRLQFDTSGQTAADPTLIDRITRSYNANMGR